MRILRDRDDAPEPGDETRVVLSDGRTWPGVPLRTLSDRDKLAVWEADAAGYFAAARREARAEIEAEQAEREARRRDARRARVRRALTPWRRP